MDFKKAYGWSCERELVGAGVMPLKGSNNTRPALYHHINN